MMAPVRMNGGQSQRSEKILNLTLKIIYLLIGEDYKVVRKTSGERFMPAMFPRGPPSITVPPCHIMTTDRYINKKILEVTQKIIELLTGEVPIRCQDVTVYFSMEEWEYLEGHKDLSKDVMMEHQRLINHIITGTKQCELNKMILNLALDVIYCLTGEECAVVKTSFEHNGMRKDHNVFPKLSRNQNPIIQLPPHSHPNNKEEQKVLEVIQKIMELLTGEVPIRCQDVTVYLSMEEWEYLEGHKDFYKDVMIEDQSDGSRKRNPPQRCPHPQDSNQDPTISHYVEDNETLAIKVEVKEEEQMYVRGDRFTREDAGTMVPVKEESLLNIRTDHLLSSSEEYSKLSPNLKVEENSVSPFSPGERHDKPYSAEISMDPEESPERSHTINQGFPLKMHSVDRSPDLSNHEESSSETSDTRGEISPFQCSECDKGFSKKSYLISHQRTHNNEGLFLYSEGENGPTYSSQLLIQQGQTSSGWPYSCSECGKSLKTKCELRVHQRIHTGEEVFSCTECDKSFTAKSQLKKHQKYHTREKPFSCPQCMKSFMEKSQFVAHQRSHSGEKPFSCNECGKSFATKSHRAKHQKVHTGVKPFPCSECKLSFTTISDLVKHQRVHTGEKPFSCPHCGKCFSQKGNLITHLKRHTGEMPFSCSECGKCFTSNGRLLTHQRSHTGERPFSCPECGRSFTQEVNLLRHQRSHKGERPFSCSECGKCFTEKGYLIVHQRNHTGERPFACSECGKCFTRKGYLLTHQRSHTSERPFSCSLCEKSFTQKVHLLTHQRTHTGERPFACPECGKCFAEKRYLLVHQRRHAVKRPFSCSECGKCFMRMKYLLAHQQSHLSEHSFSFSKANTNIG